MLFIKKRRSKPPLLHKKITWKEKHTPELIMIAGAILIILLFLFAYLIVGRMESGIYYNGGLI